MGRALVALVVLLALTGCSTAAVPSSGLSAEEQAVAREISIDSYWESTGLSDELRPPNPRVTVVASEQWGFAYVKCMFVAGFEDYTPVSGGGYTMSDQAYEDRSEAEVLADYVCSTSLEIEGQYESYFNEAERDYVFDYYARFLVPCLSLQGFEVVRPPTREQFTENFGFWHPYFSVRTSQQEAFFADDSVPVDCPPMPDGIADPGYAAVWEYR